MKYFLFGVWLISYNCLQEIPQSETRCDCYFIAVILLEVNRGQISFRVIKCYVNTIPEMKTNERKHLRMRI